MNVIMMMLVKCGFIKPFGNTLGVKNGHVAMVIGVIDCQCDNFNQILPLKTTVFLNVSTFLNCFVVLEKFINNFLYEIFTRAH